MMELLAPAATGEAVVAAVQSGADAVYIPVGPGWTTEEDLQKALRYCRVRDCRVYVSFPSLYPEPTLTEQLLLAERAVRWGADAFLVQDLGLARALGKMLPELPLCAAPELDVHDLPGVLALHALGFSKIFLAPELSLADIRQIAAESPVPVGVLLQGERCASRRGSCRLAEALSDAPVTGPCPQPCRQDLSLGGRMDDHPLSLRDFCLLAHLDQLERAGVSVGILGRPDLRPEHLAMSCRLALQFLRDGKRPTEKELTLLEDAFSRYGVNNSGFIMQENQNSLLSAPPRPEPEREVRRHIAEIQKSYADGELRRVPVRFAARLAADKPAEFAVMDSAGNRAFLRGPIPQSAASPAEALTADGLADLLSRTGGTPYLAGDPSCETAPGLTLPEETLSEIRRTLLQDLSEVRHKVPPRTVCPMPPTPVDLGLDTPPKLIVSLRSEDQLSRELADLKPDYLYLPLELLAEGLRALPAFTRAGAGVAAVLPPVLDSSQTEALQAQLRQLQALGIQEVVAASMSQVLLCRALGFTVRGGLGLQAANAGALQCMRETRLASATLSPDLSMAQVRAMPKPLPAELVVYGRLPVMLLNRCIIKKSAGRCNCHNPCSISNREGAVFPIMREFGCKNVIYDNQKLFLADHRRDYERAGLWAIRLEMTTESPRECAAVVKAYKGLGSHHPNGITHGRYYH